MEQKVSRVFCKGHSGLLINSQINGHRIFIKPKLALDRTHKSYVEAVSVSTRTHPVTVHKKYLAELLRLSR